MKNGEGNDVYSPIVLIEKTGTRVGGLNPGILAREMQNMQLDKPLLAKKEGLDDVHLDECLDEPFSQNVTRFAESVYQTTEEEGAMQSAKRAFLRVRSSL